MNSSSGYVFRLYIAGDAMNSRLAQSNLEKILNRLQVDDYQLDIVDMLENPQQALADAGQAVTVAGMPDHWQPE